VAAVIVDTRGRIMSWGWNGQGSDGLGLCAERMAIKRANKDRLFGSVVFVAGKWRKSGKFVSAKPCEKCQRVLTNRGMIYMDRDEQGRWQV